MPTQRVQAHGHSVNMALWNPFEQQAAMQGGSPSAIAHVAVYCIYSQLYVVVFQTDTGICMPCGPSSLSNQAIKSVDAKTMTPEPVVNTFMGSQFQVGAFHLLAKVGSRYS